MEVYSNVMAVMGKYKLKPFSAADKVVVILGCVGSGRSVVCSRLQREQKQINYLSCQSVLEEEVANQSLGTLVQDTLEAGKMVPMELINAIVKARIKESDKKFCLLDNYPRGVEVAKLFEAEVQKPTMCIVFECPKEIMLKRYIERGGDEEGLTEAEIREKFEDEYEVYETRTKRMVEFYRKRIDVPLHAVDASGDLEEVHDQVLGLMMQSSMVSYKAGLSMKKKAVKLN